MASFSGGPPGAAGGSGAGAGGGGGGGGGGPPSRQRSLKDRLRDGISFSWQSKSRSVDHGFVAPFDLDSLRSKVEGRFESVDKLSRSDSDGGGPGKDGAPLGERRPASAPPPIETTTYTVAANDTLTSVAARFDTTPSELAKLNRLGARLVFPGQVLRVPLRGPAADHAAAKDQPQPPLQPPAPAHAEGQLTPAAAADAARPSAETDILESLRPVSPKPTGPPLASETTHPTHTDTTSSCGASLEEQRAERRFLKINVRHITDGQGVVGGVLLVTPNAVMFDPNVSDPLVIEHGPEMYGVIAPMEYVVNAAIYYDIAHMRVGHHTGDNKRADTPKPEIYHSKAFQSYEKGQNSPGKDSLLVKDETFPELAGPARSSPEDNESECSCPGREDGDAFPKAFERDLVTPTNLANTVENGTDADSRQTKDGVEETTEADDDYDDDDIIKALRSAEERRRSCIDHHWAVPSSERDRSLDKDELEADGDRNDSAVSAPCDRLLEKHSCHDSGIDIREVGALGDQAQPPGTQSVQEQQEDDEEEIPIVLPSKKVFSDADIILAPKTEWVPPRTVSGPTHVHTSQDSPPVSESGRKKTSSVSFSLDSNQEGDSGSDKGEEGSQKIEDPEKQESRKNKMLKRLSYPLSWMEGITGEKDDKDPLVGLPTPSAVDAQQHSSMFSKVFSSSPINLVDFGLFKTPSEESSKSPGPGPPPPTPALPDTVGRSSVGTFIRQQEPRSAPPQKPTAPKLDYRSMVSVEDMPELFVSFDKLIPRPARSCEDPPLYLTLRMGKPLNKKIPKSTPIMSYGKKKMRPEYWFSVPRNRVDELYSFLMLWIPHLYGDLEEIDFKSRGYELVESDTELWDEEVGDGNGRLGDSRSRSGSDGDAELGELTRESWEVLSMSEELRRALYANNSTSIDLEFTLPELSGTTEILSEEHRRKLCRHLPARAEGYVWTLVFSTSQHGFSLNSMYRKMNRLESPILLVIEDTENNVFGALTSCALKVSDHFYGTGESLLFRFTPEFQVFNWTGDNLYFIKGNNESLSIGAGDGKFGLWLDGDLYQGRTEPCSTYGNEPLTPQKDFVVKTLECWAFI